MARLLPENEAFTLLIWPSWNETDSFKATVQGTNMTEPERVTIFKIVFVCTSVRLLSAV